ncbi:Short-chain dehydrogenase/reductase SDR [Macleaya cordata]|uniref:Short-chain dehydrogenase/reductase SDR n=1 Tax=Macleaya cordata TaxID=56857 RepID=A0A200PYT1_MACCD|nr:Short-chain dehydrogenase/reductase SDR [Macleaya cordata]
MKTILMELIQSVQFLCTSQFWRMSVLWTFSLLFSYFQLWLDRVIFRNSRSYPRCSPPFITPSTKRPICVVTGKLSKVHIESFVLSYASPFLFIYLSSLPLVVKQTVKEIKQWHPDAHLKAFQVDLSSFESMLKFKRSLQQWLLDSEMDPSIQLLVNNAGILATSGRLTAEGFDQMIGTNYIAAFALTNLLLPLLKSSSVPSRVVNVTSFTHRCVSDILVDKETLVGNFLVSKQYPCAQVYEYSKLFLLLLSYELHRQFCFGDKSHQVSVIAADPGVVETNIMREVPSHLSFLAVTILRILGLLQSPDNGVESIIDAALAPPEVSGQYFFGGRGRVIKSSALSYDTKLAEKLWTTSSQLFLELQLAYKDQAS